MAQYGECDPDNRTNLHRIKNFPLRLIAELSLTCFKAQSHSTAKVSGVRDLPRL